MDGMLTRDVLADPVALTRALVDIESVSGNEAEIADRVEEVLPEWLRTERFGNTIVARTELGRPQRVVLAGHLDTVPLHDNWPSTVEGNLMHGCGTADMKSGTAVALHLAVTLAEPRHDVTYVFYECEEVDSDRNGLKILADNRPELLTDASFAVLLEPTHGLVEAGCQGTLRVLVRTSGKRAHSARSWLGDNAIHKAAPVLRSLQRYRERIVTIDGCEFHEGLNAVRVSGGVAGNVIPDECVVEVNFRFAPDRSEADAQDHVREVFEGFDVEVVDSAPGALPGLDEPPAQEFLAAIGRPPRAKLGWTDVARFATLGIPGLNYGPGDPNLAHKQDEHVEIDKIVEGAAVVRRWLSK
ncbi:succinyl-diaminopimelate desuccinylase [Dactylosporangium roseum]|uniref:Succinyl-diaminopimelate desuccinylase n=2 Tax=Dactylosporangium roseum TaxID=47989 RepID=A0ABY5Z7L9_9ACTN|nr:succinyl-diaminopimelate desuccinylase [Dactylosporangium roseum]UWZ37639.1 succinyl-diaminopimelate desuccinylase [Dactylosporangium roseum]